MGRFKKVMVLMAAAVMIIGITVSASASGLIDIAGTSNEADISRLAALGIVSGYEDGTFKPEQSITRAEFAKIICNMLGMQSAAELSKGTTKFSDVPANYWAAGYISIVSSQGIIKGYPDGTFKPDANVTYAEAVTMLVRSLGLAPVIEGKGSWPANYVFKASELGITKGLTSSYGTDAANRGNIAGLCWNTLTQDKWGPTGYTQEDGVKYGPLNESLLQEKYSDYAYLKDGKYEPKIFEDVQVTGTQLVGGLGADQIQLSYTNIANKLNITSTSDTPKRITNDEIVVKAPGLDTFGLLGKKVDIMLGKDNEVVDIRVKSPSIESKCKFNELKSGTNKVKIAGKEYTTSTDMKIYVNTKSFSSLAEVEKIIGSETVKVNAVLNSDNNKVTILDIFAAGTNAQLGYGTGTRLFIVKEVRSSGDVISLKNGEQMFNLNDVTGSGNPDKKAIIVKNGKRVSKEEIKAGDVVTIVEVDAGSLYYIVVSDKSVTGKVTVINAESSGYKLTVNSVGYSIKKSSDAMMTKSSKTEDAVTVDDSITDYLNEEVTLKLDANGEAAYISGSVKASASEQYGLLIKPIWEASAPDSEGRMNKYMQIRTSTGEKKIFTVIGDKYKTAVTTVPYKISTEWDLDANRNDKNMTSGTLVQYKVNSDGKVNASNLVRVCRLEAGVGPENPNIPELAAKTGGVYAKVDSVNADAKLIVSGGTTYYYANTLMFNANTNASQENLQKVNGWSSIAGSSGDKIKGTNVYIIYDTGNKTIKCLVVDVDSYLKSNVMYGMVTKTEYLGYDSDGSYEWKINVFTDGTEYAYTVANGVYDATLATSKYAVKTGDFIRYSLDGEGKFDGTAGEKNPLKYTSAKRANIVLDRGDDPGSPVKEVVGGLIFFDEKDGYTKARISVRTDAQIYDVTGAKPIMVSLKDIKPGYMVKEADVYNGQFGVIIILKK